MKNPAKHTQISPGVAISIFCLLLLAITPGLAQAPGAASAPSPVEIVKKQIDALTQLKKNNELLLQEQKSTLERLAKIEKTAAQLRLFSR